MELDPSALERLLTAGVDELAERQRREREEWMREDFKPGETLPFTMSDEEVQMDALRLLTRTLQPRVLLALAPADKRGEVQSMLAMTGETTVSALHGQLDPSPQIFTPDLQVEDVTHRTRGVRRAIELVAEARHADEAVAIQLADADVPESLSPGESLEERAAVDIDYLRAVRAAADANSRALVELARRLG